MWSVEVVCCPICVPKRSLFGFVFAVLLLVCVSLVFDFPPLPPHVKGFLGRALPHRFPDYTPDLVTEWLQLFLRDVVACMNY
jgi:hypothetical protein